MSETEQKHAMLSRVLDTALSLPLFVDRQTRKRLTGESVRSQSERDNNGTGPPRIVLSTSGKGKVLYETEALLLWLLGHTPRPQAPARLNEDTSVRADQPSA